MEERTPSPPSPKRLRLWGLPLVVLLICAGYWFTNRPAQSAVQWLSNFDEAAATAKQQEIPLLVDFWASWCGPCQALDGQVFASADVAAAIRGRFIPVRIDLTRNTPGTPATKVALRYADPVTGQMALPTILVVSPKDGAIIARASDEDLASPRALIHFLDRHAFRNRD